MSKQYTSGYLAELEIIHILRDAGYFATRSAGSHTVVDIFAVNKNEVKLIQSKKFGRKTTIKSYINSKSLQKDIDRLRNLKSPANVSKEMWIKWKGQWKIIEVK